MKLQTVNQLPDSILNRRQFRITPNPNCLLQVKKFFVYCFAFFLFQAFTVNGDTAGQPIKGAPDLSIINPGGINLQYLSQLLKDPNSQTGQLPLTKRPPLFSKMITHSPPQGNTNTKTADTETNVIHINLRFTLFDLFRLIAHGLGGLVVGILVGLLLVKIYQRFFQRETEDDFPIRYINPNDPGPPITYDEAAEQHRSKKNHTTNDNKINEDTI